MRKLVTALILLTLSSSALAQEAKPIPSYFRIDQDYLLGTQLWAGATYPLSSKVGLATGVFIVENSPSVTTDAAGGSRMKNSWYGEFDLGPSLTLGPVSLTPMAGIGFDWADRRAVALNVPQLYTIVSFHKIYFESWVWTLLFSPFKNPIASDYIHTRDWVLYKLNDTIGIGPQIEYTYNMNTRGSGTKGTVGMPLGAHIELAFGAGNSLGLFAGYELMKAVRNAAGGNAAEGRITFVHNF